MNEKKQTTTPKKTTVCNVENVNNQTVPKWKQILKIVSICFVTTLLVFVFICMSSLIINKKTKGIPMIFGYSLIFVSSESMVDAGFNVKQREFIKECKADNYKIGDFIAFYDFVDPKCDSPDKVTNDLEPSKKAKTTRIVFHEIVDIYKDSNNKLWFKTKGTNNLTPDSNIIYENYVIGKHIESSKGVLSFIEFATSLPGTLLFVVLPCSIIAFKDCWVLINIAFNSL